MTRFLLKINGEYHGPRGICRPRTSADWDGGDIAMPWDGPRPSSHADRSPGPAIQPGDDLFIWTHEDVAFGNGLGLTATAIADSVQPDVGHVLVRLRGTVLIPRPFGFRRLGERASGSPLLSAMDRDRWPRAWVVSDDDATHLNSLISEFGQPIAPNLSATYVNPWDLAIAEERDVILAGAAERKTAMTKARPGQEAFRAAAMARHGGKCVLSGCRVPEAVEAAHVIPHTGHPQFERPDNSLLLRRDLHALFDALLIGIHPASGRVELAQSLMQTPYGKLKGREVDHKLAKAPLEFHFRQFRAARARDGGA